MDAQKLLLNTVWIKHSGNFMCTEECIVLKNSLTTLQKENHFKNIYLWGKIIGTKSSYYISYGYRKDVLNNRIFYYSTDGMNWGLMPASPPSIQTWLKFCSNRFIGDPAFLSDIIIGADANFSSQEMFTKRIKEEDRLAATITLISDEAAIFPRGALFKHHDGITTENKHFQGLSKEESKNLHSYVHYRIPKFKWNTNLLTRADYSYEMDFMDTVDLDIPKGCWSLKFECGGQIVTLQNLFWTGMTFIHNIGTPEYYFIYIGNGKKNIDAPFML